MREISLGPALFASSVNLPAPEKTDSTFAAAAFLHGDLDASSDLDPAGVLLVLLDKVLHRRRQRAMGSEEGERRLEMALGARVDKTRASGPYRRHH